jgi:hypothetical protein
MGGFPPNGLLCLLTLVIATLTGVVLLLGTSPWSISHSMCSLGENLAALRLSWTEDGRAWAPHSPYNHYLQD